MKKHWLIIYLIVFGTPQLHNAQDENDIPFFSTELARHLTTFKKNSKDAYNKKDFVRGRFLFDSLVKHCLVNTKFDDFIVKTKSGKIITLNTYYKKPIFLMTNTLWCYKSNEEITAINELVKAYHKEIDFVALYWSTKKEVKSDSKKYSSLVHITYINEKMNVFSKELKNLKHSFGFPTYFFINKDRTVKNIIKLRPLSPIEKKKGRKQVKEADVKSYKESLNKLIT